MPSIRPIAVAVLRHPVTGAVLVDEYVESGTGRTFHRLPGGGIGFHEVAADTIAREMDEEYGLTVHVSRRIGVVENLFTLQGEQGHEIVLVHEAELVDPSAADFDRRPSRDAHGVTGVWRSRDESELPLLPAEMAVLLWP